MRLTKGKQYKIRWIDAFGEASWTSDEELDKLIELHSDPAEQTLYFIKQTPNFYIFTSGKPNKRNKDYGYIDIHAIPKGWITELKQIK